MVIDGRPMRRTAVRPLWCVLLLAVLAHVPGCAHGPLSSGPGRVDASALTPAALSSSTPAAAPAALPERAAPGSCGHRHQAQECAGIDAPALPQPDSTKVPLPAPAPLDPAAFVLAEPGRAPPLTAGPRPGTSPRALLQIWRN
ncbi:hypothetical protein AAHZ94_20330 [Streptomyces sp. HSW2009]|uniref:hypothetical protein n=1 Tax=Streptomyces sp. HSW2009 TaxID=3142890 RepID=UPI0032F03FEA